MLISKRINHQRLLLDLNTFAPYEREKGLLTFIHSLTKSRQCLKDDQFEMALLLNTNKNLWVKTSLIDMTFNQE